MSALDSWLPLSGLVNGPGLYAPGFGLSYMILTGLNRQPEGARYRLYLGRTGVHVLGIGPRHSFVPTTTPHRARRFKKSIGRTLKKLLSVFVKGIITTFQCKPFRKICLATFLVFNAFNTIAAFSWFIIVYYMNGGDAELCG